MDHVYKTMWEWEGCAQKVTKCKSTFSLAYFPSNVESFAPSCCFWKNFTWARTLLITVSYSSPVRPEGSSCSKLSSTLPSVRDSFETLCISFPFRFFTSHLIFYSTFNTKIWIGDRLIGFVIDSWLIIIDSRISLLLIVELVCFFLSGSLCGGLQVPRAQWFLPWPSPVWQILRVYWRNCRGENVSRWSSLRNQEPQPWALWLAFHR